MNFFKTSPRLLAGAGLVVASVLVMCAPAFANAQLLTRQLQLGMTGSDVSSLQSFLAADNTIYPQGIVSGYFGNLTSSAVSNFQARNDLPTVGRVGPLTLSVINAQMISGMPSNSSAPIISNTSVSSSRTSANVSWNTNESAKGIVYYSTSPLSLGEHLTSVDVSGSIALNDGAFRTSQTVTVPNLQPNTLYYYTVYTTDAAGNVSMTWPTTFVTTN